MILKDRSSKWITLYVIINKSMFYPPSRNPSLIEYVKRKV